MISKERFQEKFGDLAELMGWRISDKRAKLIYERVIEHEVIDFSQAVDMISSYEHFDFHKFEVILKDLRAQREDREQEQKKTLERETFMRWWRSNKEIRHTCQTTPNYECYRCERKYCDIVSVEALKQIKEIMEGEKTLDEANIILSKFKGIGFENTVPQAQAF